MTSDFFLEEADEWRQACWDMMRQRPDLRFAIITKRIHRFWDCIPRDWGDGYENVTIYCTVENQKMADYRLPIYLSLPIRHKHICHEPMLEPIQIEPYLASGQIELVLCGGESGPGARPCHYDWILSTREQCMKYQVPFHFKQTGAVFVMSGRTYHIERKYQQSQAAKAGIDYRIG
jgi:protein gp37